MRLVPILFLLLLGCTNEDATREVLEAQGFKNITITGHEAFACSDDDHSCTGFHATSPTGQRVKGVVGCGLIGKACTVRFTP